MLVTHYSRGYKGSKCYTCENTDCKQAIGRAVRTFRFTHEALLPCPQCISQPYPKHLPKGDGWSAPDGKSNARDDADDERQRIWPEVEQALLVALHYFPSSLRSRIGTQ